MTQILLDMFIGISGLAIGIIIGQNFFPRIKREINSVLDRIDGKAGR